jgi:hypothetical protein
VKADTGTDCAGWCVCAVVERTVTDANIARKVRMLSDYP